MDRVVVYDVPDEGKKCLGRAVWTFVYFERLGLVLDRYAREERDSLRKQFQTRSAYTRIGFNRSDGFERISEADAPLPDWVKDQAKEIFFGMVQVRKWERR